jgi:hypothetical protein
MQMAANSNSTLKDRTNSAAVPAVPTGRWPMTSSKYFAGDSETNVLEERAMPARNHKPLTAPEKAFWKDAFLACAHSTLLRHNGKRMAPDLAAECANFADAGLDAYRSRIIWRKLGNESVDNAAPAVSS